MSELHITPRGDVVEHDMADDCACGPRLEAVPCEDGSVGWLCIHHSLDGREAKEGDRDGG